MASNAHTYGAKCRLAPVARVQRNDDLPPIEAQFFYSSVVPIDDPLSTGSVIGPPETKSAKGQMRPFARGDNNALEKAWLGLISDEYRQSHEMVKAGRGLDSDCDKVNHEKLALLVKSIASRHWERHRSGYQPQDMSTPSYETVPSAPAPVCCTELLLEVSEELDQTFCALIRRNNSGMAVDEVVKRVVITLNHMRDAMYSTVGDPSVHPEASNSRPGTSYSTNSTQYPAIRISKKTPEPRIAATHLSRSQTPVGSPIPTRPPPLDDGISGKPFVRVGSPLAQSEVPFPKPSAADGPSVEVPQKEAGREFVLPVREREEDELKENNYSPEVVEVAVGVSRLHMVSLPTLQMKPIYWSPINDIAVVTRATWFYRYSTLGL